MKITVFNLDLNGGDAENFLNKSLEEKKDWILKNTNQRNENLINEFLSNPIQLKEGKCVNCGELDNKIVRHANISKANVTEAPTNSNEGMVGEPSKGNSPKRRTKPEDAKD